MNGRIDILVMRPGKGGGLRFPARQSQNNHQQQEKEIPKMKKVLVSLAAIAAVVSMASSKSMAYSQYRDDVNNTCGTSYSCSFCHETSNKQAYLDNGACNFCPNDADCTTNPPPSTCTDTDKDGYFAEPGCGQLYDCNDSNINIYPGAREIPCDGVDQDCSGADKLKGKGCRR
jgi:hypothetical protein